MPPNVTPIFVVLIALAAFAFVLSLPERTKPHPLGVGILVGIATLAYFTSTGKAGPWDLNQGFVARAQHRRADHRHRIDANHSGGTRPERAYTRPVTSAK